MDNELMCNILKCHRKLETLAWVTSCSHIFCDECANDEFSKARTCPACNEKLQMKCDLVRVDLQPDEAHKSMILAGLKPDIIMEICSRAISFWNYQVCQELAYLQSSVGKGKEKRAQLEQMCTQLAEHAETEISSLKSQLAAGKKEIEIHKQKVNEMVEKLTEKSRQHQKLQNMYDTLRRQCISSNVKHFREGGNRLGNLSASGTGTGSGAEPLFSAASNIFGRNTAPRDGEFSRVLSSSSLASPHLRSPAQRDLGLQGTATPVASGLQLRNGFLPSSRNVLPSPRDSARRKRLF